MDTVNLDIFACMHFHAFPKIGNLAQIHFRVSDIATSMWHYKSYFTMYIIIFANI